MGIPYNYEKVVCSDPINGPVHGRIKAGADGAAPPGPPKNRPTLYQVNEVIKVTDTITFKK